MKSLTKAQLARRDEIVVALQASYDKLGEAIDKFNAAVEEAWSEADSAVTAYNEALAEANSFQEEIAVEIQGYMDSRSEAWLEGERGAQYAAWLAAWEDSLDEIEIDQPEPLELPDNVGESLEALPEDLDSV